MAVATNLTPSEAYAEAERLIAEAAENKADTLYLRNLGLDRLPPEIGRLTALRQMDLDNNQLSSIPPEIGGLTALRELNLNNNELSCIPPEIGRLTALTTLFIGNNQLSAIPPEIGRLTALTTLYLGGNQLASVPPEIGQLTSLMTLGLLYNQCSSFPGEIGELAALAILDLSHNHFSCCPPEIGQLTALTTLDLSGNRLSSLPPEIGRLAALTTLDLSGNWLSSLPPEIGQLTALTELDLSNNQLSTLPSELGWLTALKKLTLESNHLRALPVSLRKLSQLTELYLHDNRPLGLLPEILGPTSARVVLSDRREIPAAPAAILDYYFSLQAPGGRRALNEVKVILVGQGSVGKTSLVKRIVYGKFNKREKKTEGIHIEKKWRVAGKKKGQTVQVNFWDFGGQEIMHATHQFFLTKRTVYVLVLDARKGENESNIHYWLKIIRSYGGDSPILVVTNKCEAHHLDLNETRLRQDYPNIKGFFKTSCEKGTGIDELKKAIEKQIRSLPHVFDPLPAAYFTVKRELEALAAKRNYIDIDEYRELCRERKVTERDKQDQLLRFLHDLGSVLSFTDPESPLAVREMSVLNPDWVTEGVYKILNDEQVAEAGGVLRKSDLDRILRGRKYPSASCRSFVIGMMRKFELCFAIKDDEQWLVAELLPVNEPGKLGDWDSALRFQYHYAVLPSGIICRFIVRRTMDLMKPPVYWHSGVVLQHDGSKALVRSDTDKGRMYVTVTGPEGGRRAFLSVIRDEFARIHATIPNLLPEEMVPLPDDPGVTVGYEHLLTLEQQEIRDFIPQGAKKRYAVTELLDGIEDPWLRAFGESHLYPPLFVIEPQTSFANAWEVFCCEVLNRHEKTTEIYRRKPPESGVDLYWPSKKTAYQCKSVEESTGRFSITKAVESCRSAMKIQKTLKWEKYVLCSNVAITGNQEEQLRAVFQEIELLTPSFWVPRCREQSEHLGGRFRRLGPMDSRRRHEGA